MTYLQLIGKLERNEPFSFSRFGDGEFNCMFGKCGANCDGHQYYTDLGERLNEAWNDPKGIIAVQRLGYEMYKDRLEGEYADADILHRASIKGELDLFLEVLKSRKQDIILVAPERLKNAIPCRTFIEVPLKNAWLEYEHTLERIRFHVNKYDIVLYCCGMMAEVLIHDMFNFEPVVDKFTQIDLGSVLDPYVGVNSRTYHKKLNI